MAGNPVDGDRYMEIDGKLLEIKRQLRQKSGYPYELNQLERGLQRFVEGRFGPTEPQSYMHQGLRLAPGEHLPPYFRVQDLEPISFLLPGEEL